MTQALLNNLNNMINSTCTKNDATFSSAESSFNFEEILSQKTTQSQRQDKQSVKTPQKMQAQNVTKTPIKQTEISKINTNTEKADVKNNNKICADTCKESSDAKSTNEISNKTNSQDATKLTDISNSTDETNSLSIAENNEIIQENNETDVEETTIIETNVQVKENEIATEINNIAESEALNILIDDTKEETPITEGTEAEVAEVDNEEEIKITDNEDPTMYKEQITLENPSAILLSQAHIITKNQRTEKDDSIEIDYNEDNQSISFKTTGNDTLTNEQAKSALAQSNVKYTIPVKDNTADKTNIMKHIKDIINEEKVKELNIETIEADSAQDGTESGNLMQNQTPQEQVVKAMIRGDVKIDALKLAQQTEIIKTTVKMSDINPSRIVEQITKQLEGMYSNTKVNIILNPANLGKVALNIMNTKDGLQAQFTVTTQDARDLLLKGLNGLKEGLLAHGVNVDNVAVKLSETGDSEHQSDLTEQDGSRGGYKGQGFRRQKGQEQNFEQMMFELEEDGNV